MECLEKALVLLKILQVAPSARCTFYKTAECPIKNISGKQLMSTKVLVLLKISIKAPFARLNSKKHAVSY
jgi:hypothetical protein